ncbi:radical SAM protein [Candidatus Omnitrophota bacterium]
MSARHLKHIYGPVASWRLGSSLGIDLLSGRVKHCSFDCLYCQLGPNKRLTTKRKLYVPTKKIIAELKLLPGLKADYITFSGMGEPTLAKNLGQAIRAVKKIRPEPVAVLTNATLLGRKSVRNELLAADLVAVKLDADSQSMLESVNQPAEGISFSAILSGIRQFRKEYHGEMALQIMFVPENQASAKNLAQLARQLDADCVQINTPRRASAVKPLRRQQILAVKKNFRGIRIVAIDQVRPKRARPLNKKDTQRRRRKI